MHVYPAGIKQQPGRQVEEPVSFTVVGEEPTFLKFPCRLAQHMGLRRGAQLLFPGARLAVHRFLFPPSSRSGFEFEDRALPSGEFVLGWPTTLNLSCPRAGACAFPALHAMHGLVLLPYAMLFAGAIWNRVVGMARRLGLYRGQSVHSFRRGSMQCMAAQGASREQIMQRAHIKTPEVAARYLNKRRAQTKLEKQGRGAKLTKQG